MTDHRRMLCVCAHPDDETIHMGGTLARYAAAGVRVVCLTATRGELGEIVDPALASPDSFARLGEIRMAEMRAALGCLGSMEARWLGYRDSGLADDPRSLDDEAFCRVDLEEVAGRIARVIREVRPHVVITLKMSVKDAHPDHIHAARATALAVERVSDADAWPEQLVGPAGVETWAVPKLYEWHGQTRQLLDRRTKLRYAVHDRGVIGAVPVLARALVRLLRPDGDRHPAPVYHATPPTTRIEVGPWVVARDAAIRAYHTQIRPTDELLALTPEQLRRLSPTEDYTLRTAAVPTPEDDLFAGLEMPEAEAAGSAASSSS